MKSVLTKQAKELFISGKNISDIAAFLGVSRQAIYMTIKKDEAKSGISWEELRLSSARSEESIKVNEARMLNLLIKSFDKFFEKLDESPAVEIDDLENIFKFAKIYRSILDSKQFDKKALVLETAKQTIENISSLALKHKSDCVAKFLSDFSDEIYSIVLNSSKNG